jgi:hypothetical protein
MAQIAANQNNEIPAPARDVQSPGNLSDYGVIEPLTPEPELRLMANILQDAMECYLRFANAANPNARREFRAAEKWLFGGSHDWIFSFESICDHLGTDPSFVRSLLRSRWPS